jgi:hypothetical protein
MKSLLRIILVAATVLPVNLFACGGKKCGVHSLACKQTPNGGKICLVDAAKTGLAAYDNLLFTAVPLMGYGVQLWVNNGLHDLAFSQCTTNPNLNPNTNNPPDPNISYHAIVSTYSNFIDALNSVLLNPAVDIDQGFGSVELFLDVEVPVADSNLPGPGTYYVHEWCEDQYGNAIHEYPLAITAQ